MYFYFSVRWQQTLVTGWNHISFFITVVHVTLLLNYLIIIIFIIIIIIIIWFFCE